MTSTSSVLDLTVLLAPISRKQPTGKDLRQDASLLSVYQQIKDARTAARNIERQQVQGSEKSAKADWGTVHQLAVQILSTQSKDLEVATWLIEALLREDGFRGLSDGFHLARGLCEKFWDKLYPLPDEDGLSSRIISLIGLNGEEVDGSLIIPIALVPLTDANTTKPYALWHYRQALDLLKVTDLEKREQRVSSGTITLEMIETALKQSSADFLQRQRQTLQHCIEEYKLLINALEEKCSGEAPPSSRILLQLNTCLDCLNCIGQPAVVDIAEVSMPIKKITLEAIPENTGNLKNATSREQVLQTLLQAADFFRGTEPHSPLPYVLERAVRWAKTPLPALLQELIHDESTRGQVGALTGVKFEQT